jgi:DNA-binding beta-propeller fold protein YncE
MAGGVPDAGSLRDTVELVLGNSATGFLDGVGSAARFNGPAGAVLSSDNRFLYVADTFNALVRRLDVSTGEVRTLMGRPLVQAVVDGDAGVARFQSPRAIAITSDGGLLFLADGPTVRRIDVNALEVTTIAGTPGMSGYVDGQGPAVRLGFLLHSFSMGADDRTLYISDRSNRVLRTCDTETGTIATFAGQQDAGVANVDGVGPLARFSGLGGLVRSGNTLYVADTFNHTLRTVDLTSAQVTTRAGIAGTAGIEDGDAGIATLDSPQSLAFDGTSLYVTSFQGLVRRVRLNGFVTDTVVGSYEDTATIDGPQAQARLGVAFGPPVFDATRSRIYFQDRTASSVRSIEVPSFSVSTLAGAVEPARHRDGPPLLSRFSDPGDLVPNGAQDVWFIADPGSHTIRRFERASGMVTTLAGGVDQPGSTDGTLAMARFGSPSGLAFHAASNRLYVADSQLHLIRRIDLSSGMVTTVAGDPNATPPSGNVDGVGVMARFNGPTRLALTPDGLTLYIADTGNRVIRTLNTMTGGVTRLAGTGTAGTVNGPLLMAQFRGPVGLALDATSNRLYVGDRTAHVLRVIDLMAGTVSTLAGLDSMRGPADGVASMALFSGPTGLSLNASGTALYVADTSNHTVRRIDVMTNMVTTWLGSPSRNGGLMQAMPTPLALATTYFPETVVVTGPDVAIVSDFGVYLARPATLP